MSNMRVFQTTFLLITAFFLVACGSKKDILYFQDINEIPDVAYAYDRAQHELKIAPNDNLLITVSAPNAEAIDQFNVIRIGQGGSSQILEWVGYLVDDNGDINFPLVGKIHLVGLTKPEAIHLIQSKISHYVDDPIVNIRFLNYRIFVMGEVNRPGAYTVSDERISIPEALSIAGDLTIYGNRRDVVLCRVENGEKKFYHIDMTSSSLFFSDIYYLQQNDILYVQPNSARVRSSTNLNSNMSIISVVASLASLTFTMLTFINK